jgi:HlyB family type I secretion system ABC transporter
MAEGLLRRSSSLNGGARLFSTELPILSFLPPEVASLVMDSFEPRSFSFGATILREGEKADALYVVTSGRARILKHAESGEEISLQTLRAGDTFGDAGFDADAMATATVRASSDLEVLRLDRSVLRALLKRQPELRQYLTLQSRHRELRGFFREYMAFARLPDDALQLLLSELETVTVPADTVVACQGEAAQQLFIVEEGRLRVHSVQDGRGRDILYLRRGDYFGDASLFSGEPQAASIVSVGECRLLALGRTTFMRLVDGYPDFRDELQQRVAQLRYRRTARIPLDFVQELLPADARSRTEPTAEQVDIDQTATYAAVVATPASPASRSAPKVTIVEQRDGRPSRKRRRRRFRTFPHVRQVDETDCGAACLAMVCRHFGRRVSQARIRQLTHTSLDGTSLRDICHAATELGLAARSVKASPESLDTMPLPAIVHWEGNHWVVLYDIDDRHARIADPATRLIKLKRAEFETKWTGFAALFDYTDAIERAPESKAGTAWLVPFFRPYARIAFQALGLAIVVSVLQMVLPLFTQVIVDRVLVDRDVGLLNLLIIAMCVALVVMTAAMSIQRYLLSFMAVRIDSATLDFLTRTLLALPTRYFTARRTGDIQRRLAGVRQVREFVVQNGLAGITAVTQLFASVALMLIYSPRLALVFLSTAPLYALLMRVSRRWLRPTYDALERAFGRYASYQIDAIKGIETVKALSAEGAFRELMLDEFNRVARKRFSADFTMMMYDAAAQALSILSMVLFLWVGAGQVLDGRMTIGALVAFNALVGLANAPMHTLLSIWDGAQMMAVVLDRLKDVFEQEPEQGADRSRLLPVRTLEGRVALRGVAFRYGGVDAPPILENITLDVAPNQTIAIVGRSGSGKTTLVKCLAGLLEPTAGSILYDGVDLRSLNYRDLRRHVGFVLQESHLFDDTIARNIAFGESDPDMDAVVWAAQMANAHDFIERLPLGYDTKIGESGLMLSGGQRQRIAIARAVYHRPPILIFDEATSSLDAESERAVKENMATLLEGRTAFIIAHRLSTVRDADLIVVLENGHIVEQGSHDELLRRQGFYFYLCGQQLGL